MTKSGMVHPDLLQMLGMMGIPGLT
ncbi:hypothetical protein pipiens_010130, partial [Culex pipiens pipiens]